MADSQAETQPASGLHSQSQRVPEPNSWAKLEFPDKESPGCVWIKTEFFKCGKLPDNDVSTNIIRSSELIKGLSKIHFVIQRRMVRGAPVAYIKDLSSNGTFVNGDLIGKECIRILGHKDDISLVKAEFKVCRFFYVLADNQTTPSLPKQVKYDYHVLDLISKGQFRETYFVLNKRTHSPAVMKIANNLSLNIHRDDGPLTELKTLRGLQHANIIRFHNHILMDARLYLFVEYVDGTDLGQFLRQKGKLSEPLCRHITKQIILAIEYLHSSRIAHRNIRPKNVLLSNADNPQVKIKNFRSCKKLRKGDASVATLGTTIYDAPETKNHGHSRYDVRVDVWSFGVLLYVCLCGREPVEGRENNAGGGIHYSPRDVWAGVSVLAKRVIEVSLDANPKSRFYSAQISKLPWFTVDVSHFRKRPNILTSNNKTVKRFKENFH